jgi:two-component system sensor histidine kinase DegS
MNNRPVSTENKAPFKVVLEQMRQEHERTQSEVKELEILIRQSSAEVEKASQRNAQMANRVRQMEDILDTVPRSDIKDTYSVALDAQTRLFMMRGQMEQLQAKQQVLERHSAALRLVLEAAGQEVAGLDPDATGDERSGAGSGVVRIINAQEAERQRLARQMHDGPAQSLTNLILQAEICERLFDRDQQRARAELAVLRDSVNQTFQKVRGFIFDLRPMMLDDLGLNPTIKRYVQDFEAKSGIKCSLSLMGKEQRLPAHTEVTVFRVLLGLLNNVQRHASATQVDILLNLDPQGLVVTVEDNGCGFNVSEVMANAQQRKTLGLVTTIEQVELLGGEITFDSAPRRGTRVQFRLPV